MSKIVIKTNKNSYAGGETICGIVYLKIVEPTAGSAVRLTFTGYETVCCLGIDSTKEELGVEEYMNYETELTNDPSDAAFKIGCYSLPFTKTLPDDLPGSITFCSQTEHSVGVEICYCIEATLGDMKDSQALLIKQKVPGDIQTTAETTVPISSFLGLVKNTVTATAKIDKGDYCTGQNVNLSLTIKNNTKQPVENIKVQILRSFRLSQGRIRTASKSSDSGIGQGQENDDYSPTKYIYLGPEGISGVVCSKEFNASSKGMLERGLGKVFISLTELDGSNLVPSTKGKYVQCEYNLSAIITLGKGNPIRLCIPIGAIHPVELDQWDAIEPWMANSQQLKTDVTRRMLDSEYFAYFPGFEVL